MSSGRINLAETELFGYRYFLGPTVRRWNPFQDPPYDGNNKPEGRGQKVARKSKAWWQAACQFRGLGTTGTIPALQRRLATLDKRAWNRFDRQYQEEIKIKREREKYEKEERRKREEIESLARQKEAWKTAITDEEKCSAFPERFLRLKFNLDVAGKRLSNNATSHTQATVTSSVEDFIVLKNVQSSLLTYAAKKLDVYINEAGVVGTMSDQAIRFNEHWTVLGINKAAAHEHWQELDWDAMLEMQKRLDIENAARNAEIKRHRQAEAAKEQAQLHLVSSHYERLRVQNLSDQEALTIDWSISGSWELERKLVKKEEGYVENSMNDDSDESNLGHSYSSHYGPEYSKNMLLEIESVDEWSEDEFNKQSDDDDRMVDEHSDEEYDEDEIRVKTEEMDNAAEAQNIDEKDLVKRALRWESRRQSYPAQRFKAAFRYEYTTGVMRIEGVSDGQGTFRGIYRWRGRTGDQIDCEADGNLYPILIRGPGPVMEIDFEGTYSRKMQLIGIPIVDEDEKTDDPSNDNSRRISHKPEFEPWMHLSNHAWSYECDARWGWSQSYEEFLDRHHKPRSRC